MGGKDDSPETADGWSEPAVHIAKDGCDPGASLIKVELPGVPKGNVSLALQDGTLRVEEAGSVLTSKAHAEWNGPVDVTLDLDTLDLGGILPGAPSVPALMAPRQVRTRTSLGPSSGRSWSS